MNYLKHCLLNNKANANAKLKEKEKEKLNSNKQIKKMDAFEIEVIANLRKYPSYYFCIPLSISLIYEKNTKTDFCLVKNNLQNIISFQEFLREKKEFDNEFYWYQLYIHIGEALKILNECNVICCLSERNIVFNSFLQRFQLSGLDSLSCFYKKDLETKTSTHKQICPPEWKVISYIKENDLSTISYANAEELCYIYQPIRSLVNKPLNKIMEHLLFEKKILGINGF